MSIKFHLSFVERLEAFEIIIHSYLFHGEGQWVITIVLGFMFPFHPPGFFSLFWLYQDSCYACGSKLNTLRYFPFPQLHLPIEKEISALEALTFSSKSFADLKTIFSHNQKKLYNSWVTYFPFLAIYLLLCLWPRTLPGCEPWEHVFSKRNGM